MAGGAESAAGTKLVQFTAQDGLPVYANYTSGKAGAPIFLLFHQADSNKAEYRDIAPRLNRLGYATLAVDARSGHATNAGDDRNLTADAYEKKAGFTASFEQALPDLTAALAWARKQDAGRKIYLLGSSYSANLVFFVAAAHPKEVSAVFSFSPAPNEVTLQVAPKVKLPVFVTSASSGYEVEDAKKIVQALGSTQKTQFVPQAGPHGASALSPQSNNQAEKYWQALEAFLKKLK